MISGHGSNLKFVKGIFSCVSVFSVLFSVFRKMAKSLSLMFDMLLQAISEQRVASCFKRARCVDKIRVVFYTLFVSLLNDGPQSPRRLFSQSINSIIQSINQINKSNSAGYHSVSQLINQSIKQSNN